MKKCSSIKESDKSSGIQHGQAVIKVLQSISKASKNTSIYPLDHTVSQNSLNDLIIQINHFISAYGPLRFYVDKTGLYYADKKQAIPPEKNETAALLFRDGILWIEFKEKQNFSELLIFFSILRKYRHLEDASEGDIVTALWGADLKHIRYEASDIYWEIDDFFEFKQLIENPPLQTAGSEAASGEEDGIGPVKPDSGSIPADLPPPGDAVIWELSQKEKARLRQMIEEEENWNKTNDVINILLGILREQYDPEDFTTILEFIAEELQETLLHKEFSTADRLMSSLSHIRTEWSNGRPWIQAKIDTFFQVVSSRRILGVFESLYTQLENIYGHQLKALHRFLVKLHPQAISELAPLLSLPASPDIRNLFLSVILKLAGRSFVPFEEMLIHHKNTMIVCRLIPLLASLSHPQIESLALRLTRHTDKNIRMEIMKLILRKKYVSPEDLFHLINDEDHRVKEAAFIYMGKQRNNHLEKKLLDMLQQKNDPDENHILDCYRLLGKCGSERSISFLEKNLLGKAWKSFVGVDSLVKRQGAALALLELQLAEADKILDQAANHKLENIRKAVKKAGDIQFET